MLQEAVGLLGTHGARIELARPGIGLQQRLATGGLSVIPVHHLHGPFCKHSRVDFDNADQLALRMTRIWRNTVVQIADRPPVTLEGLKELSRTIAEHPRNVGHAVLVSRVIHDADQRPVGGAAGRATGVQEPNQWQ